MAGILTVNINTGDVLVRGSLKGNVRAKGRNEVGNLGIGDWRLEKRQVFIESGEWFKGLLEIGKSTEKTTDESTVWTGKSPHAEVGAAAADLAAKNV